LGTDKPESASIPQPEQDNVEIVLVRGVKEEKVNQDENK
jgi:hypothetical protein